MLRLLVLAPLGRVQVPAAADRVAADRPGLLKDGEPLVDDVGGEVVVEGEAVGFDEPGLVHPAAVVVEVAP
jgi:hypothetical protein